LASLVCPHLRPEVGIPVQAFAALRLLDLTNIGKTQLYSSELARLIGLFTSAEIPTIVLKGPALSLLAYGNISARDYSDLDILVHPSDAVAASELLILAGYGINSYNRKVYESGFFHNKSENFYSERASVDLHWTLQDVWFPFGPDEEALWSRTETFALNGGDFRTLAAADHLLFLCVHASKHGWPTIASVVDIAALLTARPELDLVALINEATRLRFRRVVLLGFFLAHRLGGTPLGNEVCRIIKRDLAMCKLTEQISARLLTQSQRQSAFDRWLVVASTLESRSARLRMFFTHTLNPTADDYARLPLPRALYSSYYIIRPLRLAAELTSTITKQTVARHTRSASRRSLS
jgi:hypothetical protein